MPKTTGPLIVALLLTAWTTAFAGPPLETETARLPKQGTLEAGAAIEFQTSSEGTETSVPLELEYGLTDWLSVLVEPVFLTAIRPKSGENATGVGDLEMTLQGLVVQESEFMPALALAAEVKIPTATNSLIGTRVFDYSPYLIASKRFGAFDAHLNLGYAFLGNPTGVKLHNIVTYGAAGEYRLSDTWDVLAEVIGNTSSSPRSTEPTTTPGEGPGSAGRRRAVATAVGGEAAVSAEAAGQEVSGLLGVRYHVTPQLALSFGVTYDNRGAVLFRPGITYAFNLF